MLASQRIQALTIVDDGRAISMAQRVMRRFYFSSKGDPSKLPWHREEPADPLIDTVQSVPAGARVFDPGYGRGVFPPSVAPGSRQQCDDTIPRSVRPRGNLTLRCDVSSN